MEKYIMAIDQGTTGSRVLIVNSAGRIVANAYAEFAQIYPRPGWVEHDAEVIWGTVRTLMGRALAAAALTADRIAALGITNQRETTVLWDRKTLAPVHNAIVWQCRRSAGICENAQGRGSGGDVPRTDRAAAGRLFFGDKAQMAAGRGARFAGAGRVRRAGLRHRRQLADCTADRRPSSRHGLHECLAHADVQHSRPHLGPRPAGHYLDVPAAVLPEVVASAHVAGHTDAAVVGADIPIAGIAGDQQAALFGQACFEAGQAKNTYGTGCFLLVNAGRQRPDPGPGLLLTLACDRTGQPCYALEGSVFIAGAVVQWLRDGLGLIQNADETHMLAQSVPDTQGVYLVPAFAGLGAPHWDMYARGGILGITRGTTRAHIVRAALESIAYQTRDLVGALADATGMALSELRVDGGACRNDFLMQFQADLLGCPVNRANTLESTAMGAAFLAGLGIGFWDSADDIAALRQSEKIFRPHMSDEDRKRMVQGWCEAVERVKSR